MNFEEEKDLSKSLSKIISFIDTVRNLIKTEKDVLLLQDLLYSAAYAICLNIDFYIANNCYLAIPGLVLDIDDGSFLTKSLSIEQCMDLTKGRLLAMAEMNEAVYCNVQEILQKKGFFKKYASKLICDMANEGVDRFLFFNIKV